MSAIIYDRVGSKPEVSQGRGNVRFRGYSGSRFRATECLLVAEAVEKVRALNIFETMFQNWVFRRINIAE